jgi:acetylornithine deacetylase/succinyl-diaminopimelate desuccinylase-like protein
MTNLAQAITYSEGKKQASLDTLIEFLRIPSISSMSEHKPDVVAAANWCADELQNLGIENVEVLSTGGLPVVYGSWLHAGNDAATILVYGHYDVQPTDPIDKWESQPFDPDIRGENIFARGATDMKAQIVAFLKAVEALKNTSGIPVNLKFMLEGEEEVGSPNLEVFIEENKQLLSGDFCLNLDAGILAPDIPSIMFALRGLAYYEIRLQGPAADLHSGKFGGAIENPAYVLCDLIAGMRDKYGQVTLPGFYDSVRPLSEEERRGLASLPQTEQWWLEQSGAKALPQDEYTPTERATARPTLEVNGILSGFTGEGSKTVLPATAMAKISMRLVPDQTPEEVRLSLETYLKDHLPPTVSMELIEMAGCHPGIMDRETAAVGAASRALKTVFGKSPLFTRDGGSVPVVGIIKDLLGNDSLLLGFGLPDDNPHAPNEKQHLPSFYRGIETFIRFLDEI